MKTKVCRFCLLEKEASVDFFIKNNRRKDGIENYCRDCNRKRSAIIRNNNRLAINYNRRINEIEKRANGICLVCKKEALKSGYCEKHTIATMAYRHLGSKKHAFLLKEKLEIQNYKCAYSGVCLVLGENASIDHIKSRVKYPELQNSPDNIQWVDIKVNLMKREIDEDDFLNTVAEIFKNKCI